MLVIQQDDQIDPHLHGLQECFATFNIAVGIPPHSPLKSRFDGAIRRIFESGLVQYWKEDSYAIFKRVRNKFM